jgi:hypothetical protein
MKHKNKNIELPVYPEQKPPKTLFLMMGVIIVGIGLTIGWFWL